MKSKYFLFLSITMYIVALVFIKPAEATDTVIFRDIIKCYTLPEAHNDQSALLSESDITLSVANITVSHSEIPKSNERLLKYKLLIKENLRIEHTIENYICYNSCLSCYYQSIIELHRLNI